MKLLAIDIETTGLSFDSRVLCIAYASNCGDVGAFNTGFENLFICPDPIPLIVTKLDKLIRESDYVVFHNGSFDIPYLVRDGILTFEQLEGKVFDTQLMARMTGRHDNGVSLSVLCKEYGIVSTEDSEEWDYMKKRRKHLEDLDPDSVLEYAKTDTTATQKLAEILLPLALEYYGEEYVRKEGNYVLEISKMRVRGIALDLPNIRRMMVEFSNRSRDIAYELSGYGIKSGNDSRGIYRYLSSRGIAVKKSDSGNPILDEAFLKEIQGEDPTIIGLILEYRDITKKNSTWLDGFLAHSFGDGKVHPLFGAAGTYTYRLNCTQPNAQAVNRTLDIFSPSEGYVLVEADYKAMELRLSAAYARENRFAEIFASGEDFHWSTAKLIFGDGATKEHRQQAKMTNFLTIYGGGVGSLVESLGIEESRAKSIIESYRRTFRALSKASKDAERTWSDRGYLILAHGARLYARLEEIENRIYKAFNNLVQGSVSQIVKEALMRISMELPTCRPVAQIHDSLYIEVPEDMEHLSDRIREIMEESVPMWLRNRTEPPISFDVDVKIVRRNCDE